MKKSPHISKGILLLITLSFFLQFHVVAQNGWKLVYTFEENIECIAFKDSFNGFACPFQARTGIYKTTNGGISWSILNIDGFNAWISKIIFVDDYLFIGVGSKGTVIKTTDGGNNWSVKSIDTFDLKSICRTQSGKLFICSFGNNMIYNSTDNGETWNKKETEAFQLSDVAFCNENSGYAVGYYNTSIKTTNGGESWFSISPIVEGRSMFAVEFINENTGFVVGGDKIVKTTNGGNTWEIKYNSEGVQLNAISFSDEKTAWVVGTNKIVRTTNTGDNWIVQTFSPYHYLNDVSSIDSLTSFAIGGEGALYKTSNGGITDVEGDLNEINDFQLEQNYPNPFNPRTKIKYSIPRTSFVTLKVYNILGRAVATLINEEKNSGNFEIEFNGNDLSSGIYFYQLKAGDFIETKKLILLR